MVQVARFSDPSSFAPIADIRFEPYRSINLWKPGAKKGSRKVYWQSSRPLALGFTQTCQLLRREFLPMYQRSMPLCTKTTGIDFYGCICSLEDTLDGYGHGVIVREIDSGSHEYLGALDPLHFVRKFPGRLLDFRIKARAMRGLNGVTKQRPQWIWEYSVILSGTRLVFRMKLPESDIILDFKVLALEGSANPDIAGSVARSDALLKWVKGVTLFGSDGHPYYVNSQTDVPI